MSQINNTHVKNYRKLITINDLRKKIPLSEKAEQTILRTRKEFFNNLEGKDNRFVVITGPCSIHDTGAAIEYATRIKALHDRYADKLLIIMRVYFEKPRTAVGWKGLINDPHLNNSNDMETGLNLARKLLIDIAELGMPTATELLDPIIAAYIAELVTWVAIGARTTESQTHRQMASGLSAPVGFKNGTDGNLDVAINAIQSSMASHSFLSVDDDGICSIVQTAGNKYSHIVLRGGSGRPNYHMEDIEECENKIRERNFPLKIMVDCSHENSAKNFQKQALVVRDIIAQKKFGNQSIFGIMLESNLNPGNQKIPSDLSQLKYGVSLTDGCIGWGETEDLLGFIYENL
ncbi:MAG: 3-deoxy-7-phosphoheptulonate synthase [Bacteroidetes bacterium]|nr:3-deoxy-7-phosphoheptulonate synthase [Bacteroidota bacterium]